MKKGFKTFLSIVACLLLAAVLTNQFSDIITFAVEDNRYLEQVEIFTAPTKTEAIEKCRKAGFHASDVNLNEGNDGGAVVVGYTITDNPEEAITDISVLEMNNGYQMSDYSEIKEYEMEKAGLITSEFMKSVSEYRDNLKKGSPAAIEAQKILNIYQIDEMNNMGLGDYFASDKCTEDFIKKIICQANVGVIYAIFNSMSSGVADYGEKNWAQRLEETDVKQRVASGKENTILDKSYKLLAYELRSQLQSYYKQYTEAKDYIDKNGEDALKEDVESAKKCDISDETMEKIENAEKYDKEETYYIYLEAYEILSQYKYDESTTLADYILYLGSSNYNTDADLRKIYPLVEALTQGQIGVFRIAGVTQMAMSLVNNDVILDKTNEYLTQVYDLIKDAYNGKKDHLSIWVKTDQTPYNKKIARTDASIISTMSGQEFDELTKENAFDKKLDKAMTLTFVISSMINVASFFVTLGANAAVIYKAGWTAWWVGQSVSAWAVCANAVTFASGSILTSILGVLGCTVIVLGYIALVAIAVFLIIELGKYIYNAFKDDDDTLDYTVNDIPSDVYDFRNQSYIHYEAVKNNGSAKPADLNAGSGRRFSALYFTKSTAVGEPIMINPDEDAFKTVSGDSLPPLGYTSVRYFGPGAAANLNAYAKNKAAKSLYLSFYNSGETVINSGEQSEAAVNPDGKAEYLSSLRVSVQKTPTAAKDELKKAGYTPIDYNLTYYQAKQNDIYTYIGYQTTTIEKEAITDIRIVPQGLGTGGSFYYGNSSYVRAGGDAIPATIPSIYFSKSKEVGTPVYSDIQIVNDRSKAKEGYEPVNLFCGGDAYNINATGDSTGDPMSLTHACWNSEHCAYIYFHPTITFTAGEKYIGGLAFFTGKNTTVSEGDELKIFAEESGFNLMKGNFTDDYAITFNFKVKFGRGTTTKKKTVDDILTFLAYSETYNPYRAIYGIKSYTAMPGTKALNEMLMTAMTSASKESYAACNVFYQFGNKIYKNDEEMKSFSRGILMSNAWNGINDDSARTILPEIEEYPEQEAEDFEKYSWNKSSPRLKNLYVCGSIPGKAPLKVSDIRLETSADNGNINSEDGLYSVQDAKTPNRAAPHNIGISSKNTMYLYFRQDKPAEKKYISSISLSSWDLKTYVGGEKEYEKLEDEDIEKYNATKDDICMLTALQSSCDEVILRNLAVGYGSSVQSAEDNEPAEATYLAVTRTDNSADAIHSIIKFKYKNKKDAELKIKVDGAEYTRVGNEPVHDPSGWYYLYYSTGTGCAPSEPITSISFSSVPLVENCATALTATGTDIAEYVSGKEVVKTTAVLKGWANETNYIHSEFETQKTYICDIFIGSGSTEKEAMIDLMNMGCNMFVPIDLNIDAGGNFIFLGYDRYDSPDFAVNDIICTVGQKPLESLEINGAVYQRARDRYNMKFDNSKAVSFNEGTNGYSIYLYYSYDTEYSPIMNIAASERDYTPDNSGGTVWENVLTTSLNRCNLNDGVYASVDGHNVDNRVFIYANRDDNSVKPGAEVTGDDHSSIMKFGELLLKSN